MVTEAIAPIKNPHVTKNYLRAEAYDTRLCVHIDIPMHSCMQGYDKAEAEKVERAVEEYKDHHGLASIRTVWV